MLTGVVEAFDRVTAKLAVLVAPAVGSAAVTPTTEAPGVVTVGVEATPLSCRPVTAVPVPPGVAWKPNDVLWVAAT